MKKLHTMCYINSDTKLIIKPYNKRLKMFGKMSTLGATAAFICHTTGESDVHKVLWFLISTINSSHIIGNSSVIFKMPKNGSELLKVRQ